MKKKLLKFILIGIISVGLTFFSMVIVYIVSNKGNHQHIIIDEIVNPTCQNEGYTKHYCTKCDYYYKDTFIEKIDHDVVNKVIKEATCKEEGLEEFTCTMCGETNTQVIPVEFIHSALEVEFSDEYCGNNPIGYVICSECNETTNIIGHNVENIVIEPKCAESGKKIVKCTDCNLIISERIIAPLEHMHLEEIVSFPTCTESGKIDTFCVDCGEILSTEIIEKNEHLLTSKRIDSAIYYECDNCDYSFEVLDVENSYKVLMISKLDNTSSEIEIKEGNNVLLPVLNDFDYTFLGWYYEEEGINLYNNEPIHKDTTLYGLWQQETIRESFDENIIERNVSKEFRFDVTSNIVLNDSNVSDYIKVTNANNENVTLNVNRNNNQYSIGSNDYLEGEAYSVFVQDPVRFTNRQYNELYFTIEKENYYNIKYNSNVIIINENDLINFYTTNDITYLYSKNKLSDLEKPYVLLDKNENFLGAYSIRNVTINNGYYVHECINADVKDIFDEFDMYYSGKIGITAENISYTFEEEVVNEFKKSALYKQFNDAAHEFAKTESEKKYKVSIPDIKPKIDLKNGVLTLTLDVKVIFSKNDAEYLSIILRVENKIEIDADINAKLFDPQINGIIETNNHFSVSFFVRVLDDKLGTAIEEETTLKKFKEIYKILKLKDNLAIKDDKSNDNSRIKFYEGVYPFNPTISVRLCLYVNFEWYTIGQFGVTYTYHTNIKTFVNGNLNGVKAHSSIDTSSYLSAVMMGKAKASGSIEISLSLGVGGIYYIGLSGEAGPSVEIGGMVVLNVDENKDSTKKKSYYLEEKYFAKLNFILESNIFKDYKIELCNKDFPLLKFGSKEIPLYFKETGEVININTEFGEEIDLNELIDKYVLINNFDSMATLTEKVDCDFYLSTIIDKNDNVVIDDEKLIINPSVSTEFKINIAVVYADLRKDVEFNIKINHVHDYKLEIIKEPTCYVSGKYRYNCDCEIFYEETIYPTGHNFVDGVCSKCGSTDNSNLIIDNLKLKLMEDGCYEVVGYEGTIEHLVVPAGNEKFRITKISAGAFWDCNTITSIEVAEGVQVIEEDAFPYDTKLTYISLPSSLIRCDDDLKSICPVEIMNEYEGCYYIGNEVNKYVIVVAPVNRNEITYNINTESKIIGPNSFSQIDTLETILIPSNIVSVGWYSFFYCKNLSQVTFEEGSKLEKIGYQAFYNCSSLIRIKIPNNVESIGESAFIYCTNMQELTFEENSKITEVNSNAFRECRNLTYVTIPSSVRIIGSHAFYYCDKIEKIEFEDNSRLEVIESSAFADCYALINIQIPLTVISVGEGAFNDCLRLVIYCKATSKPSGWSDDWNSSNIPVYWGINDTNIYEKDDIEYVLDLWSKKAIVARNIGNNSNVSIKDVIIFNNEEYNVTIIGGSAFYGCSNLLSIILPNSVTDIGNSAFQLCGRLTSIGIPNSVIKIGSNAFENCNALESIYIPNSVISIGKSAFYGCKNLEIYCEETSKPSGWSDNWNPSNVPVHWGIDELNLYEENGIKYELNLKSKEATVISYSGDGGEVEIKNTITFNEKDYIVTCIGPSAFEGYGSLTSIDIPLSVTSIGRAAFYRCSGLKSIEIPNSVVNIGDYAFSQCISLENIKIPSNITNIGDYAFYDCSSLKYNIYDNAKYLGNSENLYLVLVSAINEEITNCIIYKNTKIIMESAFQYCSSLENIEIPNSVISIGSSVFAHCSSLKNIILPIDIKSIGYFAFNECISLTSLTIPNSVTSIGESAFQYCSSLERIEIPNSVTSIGESAFKMCSSLTSLIIPSSVISIGESAFENCENLKTVAIPNSVTSMGESVFRWCSNLTIYCEAISKPMGWNGYWNSSNRPVVWGYEKNVDEQ